MSLAYIGLGSNLSDHIEQVHQAISVIKASLGIKVIAVSSIYGSSPMGPADQPDYINAVLALQTQLSPIALLDLLQNIENQAGRVRKDQRWGPRILDLDILLFDNQVIATERLTLPHYGIKQRAFVLIPLAEIAADLVLPDGEKIADLCQSVAQNGLNIHA
jgi:2-amino-4-hydroxy-6-hydroxymethyldihydropteridine diphosphokinase